MLHQSIIDIPEILSQLGVEDAVISPGSRSAPLVLAFSRHPKISCYVVPDERSAGFIALGMSQKTKKPVVLICTSGSAVYNYAPAVAEAFFQEIPLIILTADRPPEWIDQWDGQTIRQQNIFGSHVLRSFQYPVDLAHPDSQWYAQRTINEAHAIANGNKNGPVHVNIPFREPFYPDEHEPFAYSPNITPFKVLNNQPAVVQWPDKLSNFGKIVVVAGQQPNDIALQRLVEELAKNIVVVTDAQSNLSACTGCIHHHDLFLATSSVTDELQPDLLITFGKSVISKNLKVFLRKYKAKNHWHISPYAPVPDTFQSLTHILTGTPLPFLQELLEKFIPNEKSLAFESKWKQWDRETTEILQQHLSGVGSSEFSEFEAVKVILDQLPDQVDLHLANSMPVRYVNFLGIKQPHLEVFVNRGTSGIDGSVSTAVGCAIKSDRKTVLITGDLAFFYDSNGLWHSHLPDNLIILLLNNHGGGIFGMINGPKQQPELKQYFITQQKLTAKNTALDFDIHYELATNLFALKNLVSEAMGRQKATIIEIETKQEINEAKMIEIKSLVKNI